MNHQFPKMKSDWFLCVRHYANPTIVEKHLRERMPEILCNLENLDFEQIAGFALQVADEVNKRNEIWVDKKSAGVVVGKSRTRFYRSEIYRKDRLILTVTEPMPQN